jgi:predicted MFS family arabinose efflux permease
VANLYYNQPVLNKIAQTFDVSYETSSRVSTLSQSGYAAGLVFILPLGDILERRLFIISLVLVTATLVSLSKVLMSSSTADLTTCFVTQQWIGLCITEDFAVFQALSFICSTTTVTPQLMIPLVGDFAPVRRKATALAVVVSGLLFGVLIARLLAGVVANYTDWRNIYWLACGIQYLLGLLLFFFLPDYPSANPDGLGYLRALWSIPYMMFMEPVLVQACLIAFTLSGVFTSFWTTLTFLLASPPYEYASLQIGLVSLIGVVTVVIIPFVGSLVDRFEPLFTGMVAQLIAFTATIIGTFISKITIAGPIIEGIGIDVGYQTVQVANRATVFNINPKARNRLNTAYMVCAFAGQLTGTAVGNKLYARGGWKASGYYNSKIDLSHDLNIQILIF